MTLSTHLRIIGDVSPEGVFAKCRELIGIPQGQPFTIKPERKGFAPDSEPSGWVTTFSEPGGFDAMLIMQVAIGREPLNRDLLFHDEWCAEFEEECGEPCDHEAGKTPPCNIVVDFDSSYGGGYGENDEMDCSAWHRHLTGQLGAWLEAQGADWWAEDEFHGDWHHRLACPLDVGDRLLVDMAEQAR